MRVRDVMTENPVCCTPNMSIMDVARLMVEYDCGAIPVVGDHVRRMPLGIVTDRDIVVRTIALGRDPMTLAVSDCMTSPAVTMTEETSVRDCLKTLELGQIRRAIVVNSAGSCTGIVAQADIARDASRRSAGDLVREVSKRGVPAFAH